MEIKGVIFDFNGTLFWDADKHERAWRELAAEKLGRDISEEEFRRCVHGRTNEDILRWLFGPDLDRAELDRLAGEKERRYRRLCLEDRAAFALAPGAEELLDQLKSAHMPMTVATGSSKGNLDFYLEHFGLERWFEPGKIIYDDGSRPGKPAPDFYLAAARAIGVKPADCLVVEDAPSGFQAARRAGIGLLAAIAPQPRHAALSAAGEVDIVVCNFYELSEMLAGRMI